MNKGISVKDYYRDVLIPEQRERLKQEQEKPKIYQKWKDISFLEKVFLVVTFSLLIWFSFLLLLEIFLPFKPVGFMFLCVFIFSFFYPKKIKKTTR